MSRGDKLHLLLSPDSLLHLKPDLTNANSPPWMTVATSHPSIRQPSGLINCLPQVHRGSSEVVLRRRLPGFGGRHTTARRRIVRPWLGLDRPRRRRCVVVRRTVLPRCSPLSHPLFSSKLPPNPLHQSRPIQTSASIGIRYERWWAHPFVI